MMTALCEGPDPDTKKPRMEMPPGACDTHCHVFGPASRYPYAEDRGYTPPDALLEDYLRMAGTLGLERAVIVQASVQGADNTPTIDALARMDGRFRGIAVVRPDVSDAELERLDRGLIRGVRMTSWVRGGSGIEHVHALADRIAGFGWLVELHLHNVDEMVDLAPSLMKLRTPYLIDHFGRVRGDQGVDNEGFQALLRLLRADGNCWVKLCSFYRLSQAGPPDYADMVALARALIEACPERLVWGTNWPHPNFKNAMPNDGDLADQILGWAPDEATRRAILSDNPARLFGFE